MDALVNVPKSHVTGFELQVGARVATGLNINAAFTYLDSEVDEYVGSVGARPGFINGVPVNLSVDASFKGARLPFTPKYSFNAGFDYTVPVSSSFDAFIGANVAYQSETSGIILPPQVIPGIAFFPTKEIFFIKGRALLDANFGLQTSNKQWRVMFWGKNLTDEYYWNNTTRNSDTIIRYTGRPREYGMTVGYRF